MLIAILFFLFSANYAGQVYIFFFENEFKSLISKTNRLVLLIIMRLAIRSLCVKMMTNHHFRKREDKNKQKTVNKIHFISQLIILQFHFFLSQKNIPKTAIKIAIDIIDIDDVDDGSMMAYELPP